jgi:glycosyltransferase involved in cell wall biosynthesis
VRVSFSCSLKPDSGKQKFAIRLAKALRKRGVKITDKKPDVNIVFVKGLKKGCINVMRLDNAWINNKMNSVGKNSRIKKILYKCQGAIYQGKYSKLVCDKFIGKFRKPFAIIPNGCDPSEFYSTAVRDRPYVLAFSRWRPHKRLKTIVLGFLGSGLNEEYDLVVCGKADFIVNDPSVIYLGRQNAKVMNSLIKGCEFVVHLAYMDCCPNSVVESLVGGKNILYATSGGMKELVRSSGIGIKDKLFNVKLIDLYNPPLLDQRELCIAYKEMLYIPQPLREDLYIDNIALKYVKFIKRILNV